MTVKQSLANDQPTPRYGWPLALIRNLVLIAAIWILSDMGYYFALPALSYQPNYNHDPVAAATYYLFRVGVAAISFAKTYASWRS